ncbi:hypothetical protein ACJUA3_19145 [Citrobacter freundii]|uniref:hypothetical protein n=1 Tax=Citrobacter freundii TaxID=546 RepID=UPI0038D1F20A
MKRTIIALLFTVAAPVQATVLKCDVIIHDIIGDHMEFRKSYYKKAIVVDSGKSYSVKFENSNITSPTLNKTKGNIIFASDKNYVYGINRSTGNFMFQNLKTKLAYTFNECRKHQ